MYTQETVTYTLESLTHRRLDGTYVGVVRGLPYHVIPEDPYGFWEKAVEMAQEMGDDLEFEPVLETVVAPRPITARQLRIALINVGVTGSAVTTKINTIANTTQREIMLVEWEYGTQYNKDNQLIAFIHTSFSSSIGTLDSFWTQALAV